MMLSKFFGNVDITATLLLFLVFVVTFFLKQNLCAIFQQTRNKKDRVLIYGAGHAGMQIAHAIGDQAIAFVDDAWRLRHSRVMKLKVHGSDEIKFVLKRYNINKVLLAMPSVPLLRKTEILVNLQKYQCKLLTLPHNIDFVDNGTITKLLREVTAEDLLGRMPRSLNLKEIQIEYEGKVVMVTGGGGSIGSELCVQAASAGVKCLIILEISEFALYQINRALSDCAVGVRVVSILGSVADDGLVKRVLQKYNVEIILHAAAYKHVPIVETNEVAGAHNNAIGTRCLARVASEVSSVRKFILISTDKAVRPKSVMGATKYFAELAIIDLQARNKDIIFTIVRFGNVLNSSGSVVPLFREQIKNGGPVTVTHPDVTRFLMTINEAVQLVLLAGTFAKGGETFVLDMGEPVKIVDLAQRLITLSGATVRSGDNPRGDIEIVFTGLRPGEKLHEDLLNVDNNRISTAHPKIMCVQEPFLLESKIDEAFARLELAVKMGNSKALREVFADFIDGFQSQDSPNELADVPFDSWIYLE